MQISSIILVEYECDLFLLSQYELLGFAFIYYQGISMVVLYCHIFRLVTKLSIGSVQFFAKQQFCVIDVLFFVALHEPSKVVSMNKTWLVLILQKLFFRFVCCGNNYLNFSNTLCVLLVPTGFYQKGSWRTMPLLFIIFQNALPCQLVLIISTQSEILNNIYIVVLLFFSILHVFHTRGFAFVCQPLPNSVFIFLPPPPLEGLLSETIDLVKSEH